MSGASTCGSSKRSSAGSARLRAPVRERFGTFQELQSEVARLRREGDPEGALALMAAEQAGFPGQIAYAYFWRIRLASELGRVDEALRIMGEALAMGCRYPLPVLQSEMLGPLREIVEFERLAHIAAMRYDAELAASRPKLVVRRPAARPLGTLLVLHGNNSRADRTVPHWEGALTLGWTLALAQSAEISWTPGMFVWNEERLALDQVRAHAAELGEVVLAGYSLGALRALQHALGGAVPAMGAIAVGPFLPPEQVAALVEPRRVPTWIEVGELDGEGHAGSLALGERLRSAGVPVRVEVRPGWGHAYPPDMERVLREALGFLRSPDPHN